MIFFTFVFHVILFFLLLGCFLQNTITIGGAVRCFGIFYVAFMEEFNSKAGSTAWIAVLCSATILSGGIPFIYLILNKLMTKNICPFMSFRGNHLHPNLFTYL